MPPPSCRCPLCLRDTNARCADCPLCRVWYERSLCGLPVVGSVVVCCAWFRIDARCAGRDPVLSVIPTERPLCPRGSVPVWLAHAVGNPERRLGPPNTPL